MSRLAVELRHAFKRRMTAAIHALVTQKNRESQFSSGFAIPTGF